MEGAGSVLKSVPYIGKVKAPGVIEEYCEILEFLVQVKDWRRSSRKSGRSRWEWDFRSLERYSSWLGRLGFLSSDSLVKL